MFGNFLLGFGFGEPAEEGTAGEADLAGVMGVAFRHSFFGWRMHMLHFSLLPCGENVVNSLFYLFMSRSRTILERKRWERGRGRMKRALHRLRIAEEWARANPDDASENLLSLAWHYWQVCKGYKGGLGGHKPPRRKKAP